MDTLESAENERERSAALNVVPAACACYDMAACVSQDCVSNADGTGLLRCLPTPTRIPEKGRKGPLQGRALLGRGGRPLWRWRWAAGCSGSWNAQRKRGSGRATGGLAARSRRGVGARTGHARKSFDFNTSLCRATTHTLTTPSLWLPTVSSYSPATATPSWPNLSQTGTLTPFWSMSGRSSWRRCRRWLEAFIFIVENVPQGIAVPLLRQPAVAEHLGWALGLHSKFDRLGSRLTPSAGWE
jgi:hypothetical protein